MTPTRLSADHDEPRDQAVADALERHLALEGARSDAELDALRRAIVARAAFPLAALRRAVPWWELASGWVKLAVPLGIAAGIVGVLVSVRGPLPESPLEPSSIESYAVNTQSSTGDSLAWHTVIANSAGREVDDQLIGPVTREQLLAGAMQRRP